MSTFLAERNNGDAPAELKASEEGSTVKSVTELKRTAVPIEIMVEDKEGRRQLTTNFTLISKLWRDKFLHTGQV